MNECLFHNDKLNKPEPDWELLQEIVDFMEGRRRADVIQLMSHLTNTELDMCSVSFQRTFWEQMVVADYEETLNYRGKYMNKPFGMDILKKIALKDPKFMLIRIQEYPEDQNLQRMNRFLIQELGKEKVEELMKVRESRLLRWLFRHLFGETETESKPNTDLTSASPHSTIVS